MVKRLQLIDLTFHDLRHDAASTLTMAGAPQRAIKEILGHRDPRMTLRYQHLAPDYLKQAMRSLDRPRADDFVRHYLGTGRKTGLRVASEPREKIGGAEGARTPDPKTASLVLSQLSYSPMSLEEYCPS